MRDRLADRPGGTWRPWTIWLPCVLAFVASGLYVVADLFGKVMGGWDTPAPGLPWLNAAIIGHCVLAVAAVVAAWAGVKFSSRRRAAAITAWMIIPVGFALILLFGRLASSSIPPPGWL
jgi:hypothetical protein